MTAAYMTRCVYLTFFGEYRGPRATRTSRRAAITIPLIVLAGFAVAGRRPASTIAPGLRRSSTFIEYIEPLRIETFDRGSPRAEFARRPRCSLLARLIGRIAAGRRRHGLPVLLAQRSVPQRPAPSATPVARAGYTFLVNKYYLDDLYTDVIVGGIKGPIARARLLGQPERDRRRRQRRGAAPAAARPLRLRRTSTRGSSTASSTARRGTGEAAARAPPHPDRSRAAVRARSCSVRSALLAPRPRHRRLTEGLDIDELVRRLGADPGGLPAARGRWSSCCSSRRRTRSAIKLVALLTTLGHARRRRRHPRPSSTTTTPTACSSRSTSSWIDVINSRYHVGIDGISLPLLVLSMFITRAVRHLLLEPLPRAAQPEGVPRPDAHPRGRA